MAGIRHLLFKLEPDDIVFVDDHHDNVAGASVAGMAAVWSDITEPAASLERVRAVLARSARPGGTT